MSDERGIWDEFQALSEEEKRDWAKRVADRHELMMDETMTQFITQDHADIDTGLGYTAHICFQNPCKHYDEVESNNEPQD